jgi:hypothetical protein
LGYGNQVFAPLNLSFEESIKEPKIIIFDFGSIGLDQQVILELWLS